MFNLVSNLIIALLISFGLLLGVSSEKYITPKQIDIQNAGYFVNTKTNSSRSRNGLLIYSDEQIYYSGCLGLNSFCSKGQRTRWKSPFKIKYLITNNTPTPRGIILAIHDQNTNELIFQNDSGSIQSYLNGNRNVQYFYYGTAFIAFCYAIWNMIKIRQWQNHDDDSIVEDTPEKWI